MTPEETLLQVNADRKAELETSLTFANEARREYVATAILAALIARGGIAIEEGTAWWAVELADKLRARLAESKP